MVRPRRVGQLMATVTLPVAAWFSNSSTDLAVGSPFRFMHFAEILTELHLSRESSSGRMGRCTAPLALEEERSSDWRHLPLLAVVLFAPGARLFFTSLPGAWTAPPRRRPLHLAQT